MEWIFVILSSLMLDVGDKGEKGAVPFGWSSVDDTPGEDVFYLWLKFKFFLTIFL